MLLCDKTKKKKDLCLPARDRHRFQLDTVIVLDVLGAILVRDDTRTSLAGEVSAAHASEAFHGVTVDTSSGEHVGLTHSVTIRIGRVEVRALTERETRSDRLAEVVDVRVLDTETRVRDSTVDHIGLTDAEFLDLLIKHRVGLKEVMSRKS